QRVSQSAKSLLAHLGLLSQIVAGDHHLNLQQLEQFADALEALSTAGRLPHSWWGHSFEALGASASTFEKASALASEFSSRGEQLQAYISLQFPEAAEFLSVIETKFQTWYSRLSPAFWRWRSELKRASKPGTRLDHNTIRSHCAIARRLLEIQ